MPLVQQQENKSYILPLQHNRALLALIFSKCVFAGLRACMRSHSLEKAQGSLSSQGRFHSCALYLIFPCLSEDSEGFAGRLLDFPQYLPHPLLAGANVRFDAVNIRYVVSGPDKQCVVLQYSKVAQRWLIFEQRRNVSGGTGRIPQSCATRSLLRQESDASLGIRCCLCSHPVLLPVSVFFLILPSLLLNLSSFFLLPSFLF